MYDSNFDLERKTTGDNLAEHSPPQYSFVTNVCEVSGRITGSGSQWAITPGNTHFKRKVLIYAGT